MIVLNAESNHTTWILTVKPIGVAIAAFAVYFLISAVIWGAINP